MTRSRERPVRPMSVHPEGVISRAIKADLAATIRLQRSICNKTTKKYYERSSNRFNIQQEVDHITKERGVPDFSYIALAEAPTRNEARLIFYEKAVKYGFADMQSWKRFKMSSTREMQVPTISEMLRISWSRYPSG